MGWGMGNIGGGSGGGLNFKVAYGLTQPSSLTDNLIWVLTDVKISSYAFTATEPEAPENGMVWFAIGTSSSVEFNALKKNVIDVYPQYAKQYIDGAWVDVTAKSYQGGEWVDWFSGVYLFNDGDQCIDITGGWEKGGLSANAAPSDGVYTIGDTLTVTTNNSAGTTGRQSAIVTKKAVDVSGYKTLKVVVDYVSQVNLATYYCCFGLSKDKSNHTATKGITGTGEMSMDISTLSGSYYPFIQVSNGDRKLTVSKIWLE